MTLVASHEDTLLRKDETAVPCYPEYVYALGAKESSCSYRRRDTEGCVLMVSPTVRSPLTLDRGIRSKIHKMSNRDKVVASQR